MRPKGQKKGNDIKLFTINGRYYLGVEKENKIILITDLGKVGDRIHV